MTTTAQKTIARFFLAISSVDYLLDESGAYLSSKLTTELHQLFPRVKPAKKPPPATKLINANMPMANPELYYVTVDEAAKQRIASALHLNQSGKASQ